MPIVAKKYQYVVGVDTHARKHVYSLINNLGEVIDEGEIRVLERDFKYFLSRMKHRAGDFVLFAVEGTSSYGATLTRFLLAAGHAVCEVKAPKAKSRGGRGKTDQLDAEMGARSVLHLPLDKLIQPKHGDERGALRILLATRAMLVKQQTMEKNALHALARSIDLGIDARRVIRLCSIKEIAVCRARSTDTMHEAVARAEAKRLSSSIVERRQLLETNEDKLRESVNLLAPGILDFAGVGPVSAANVICAYSHKGRFRSEAAFASLAGVAPLAASSGNVVRHRLNRYGDRNLNCALNWITLTRMRYDEETQKYIAKRTASGSSSQEIKRSLKRYIARSLFKHLEKLNLGVDL